MSDNPLDDLPDIIYLTYCGSDEGEVCWCEDRIDEEDVAYIKLSEYIDIMTTYLNDFCGLFPNKDELTERTLGEFREVRKEKKDVQRNRQ